MQGAVRDSAVVGLGRSWNGLTFPKIFTQLKCTCNLCNLYTWELRCKCAWGFAESKNTERKKNPIKLPQQWNKTCLFCPNVFFFFFFFCKGLIYRKQVVFYLRELLRKQLWKSYGVQMHICRHRGLTSNGFKRGAVMLFCGCPFVLEKLRNFGRWRAIGMHCQYYGITVARGQGFVVLSGQFDHKHGHGKEVAASLIFLNMVLQCFLNGEVGKSYFQEKTEESTCSRGAAVMRTKRREAMKRTWCKSCSSRSSPRSAVPSENDLSRNTNFWWKQWTSCQCASLFCLKPQRR